MSEIVKCSRCRKILTRNEFQSHECEIPWKETKEIPILYYIELNAIKKPKVLGVGLDGVHYFFVLKKPVAIPFIQRCLSDESLQGHKPDDNLTEPKIVMFIRVILASELIASKAKLETIKETRLFGSDDADPAEETPSLKRTVTNRSIFTLYYINLWRN